MARETVEDWIPIETGSEAIQALNRGSITERLGRPENMKSDVKEVPRSGEFAVAAVGKGAAYGETTGTNDKVDLIARKCGGILRLAEEDITDPTVDVFELKGKDAARSLAKFYDNATWATSGTMNGTTVLYTSVYKAVRTASTNAGVAYVADTNYAGATSVTYAALSAAKGKLEVTDYYDEDQIIVAAHPAFKQFLRDIVDSTGRPIFFEGSGDNPDILFGHPIDWSMGLRVTATNSYNPTGNPILAFAIRDLLINGKAKLSPGIATTNPGLMVQRANHGVGFTTDEALLKAAMRRGFAVGHPLGFSVFEKTAV